MDGKTLKQEGMEAAFTGAGWRWNDYILEKFRAFCKVRKELGMHEFKFEDFVVLAKCAEWELPRSPQAWGSVPSIAHREGLIKPTGKYAPAKSKKTHAHDVKVWRIL